MSTITEQEMNSYLESIGGLENGMFIDREPIKTCDLFACGPGWYGIIKELIEKLIDAGWDKHVMQVKEKFGGLRFYIGSGNDKIWDAIREAEDKSFETCEICGEPGELRGGPWLFTHCDKCYEERQ